MKKILLFSLVIFSFCIFPPHIWATPRTVTITWTMSDTTNVQGYKVYYADNSAMSNEIWHSDCSSPAENPIGTFTITCNKIDLTNDQTYYFTVAAQMTDSSESTSNAKDAIYIVSTPMKPTIVQNFKIINSNPTEENIGNQTESMSTKYTVPTQIWAYKLPETPNHNGVLKSISITANGLGSPRRFKLALYTHDTVNDLPKQAITDAITIEGIVSGDTAQLMTLNIESGAPQISAGVQYWVVIQALDGFFQFYRDYNTNHRLVCKNGTTYDWGSWGDSTTSIYTYAVGKCFITYEY